MGIVLEGFLHPKKNFKVASYFLMYCDEDEGKAAE